MALRGEVVLELLVRGAAWVAAAGVVLALAVLVGVGWVADWLLPDREE